MTNPLGKVYRAGTTAGADALPFTRAVAGLFVLALVEFVARLSTSTRWAGWVDPITVSTLGLTLILLSSLLDAIPGYGARNAASFLIVVAWTAVGLVARSGHTTSYQLMFTIGWVVILIVCTFALGNGKFAAHHPIIGALYGTVKDARGDVAGAVKGLAAQAATDPHALRQLERLAVDTVRAVMDCDNSAGLRLLAVIPELISGTKPEPRATAFGGVDVRVKARRTVESTARAALIAGDIDMLRAVWPTVVDACALPAATVLVDAQTVATGPVIVFRPPVGVDGASIKLDTVRSVIAGLCEIPERTVILQSAEGVVSLALKIDTTRDDPGEFQ
jgi:hypothetical protein